MSENTREWEKEVDGWRMFPDRDLIAYDDIGTDDIKDFIRANFIPKSEVREAIEQEEQRWVDHGGHAADAACPKCTANVVLTNLERRLLPTEELPEDQ